MLHCDMASVNNKIHHQMYIAIAGDLGGTVFLPTTALQLMRTLQRARPQHIIIAADFDALPDVRIAGTNAPLVSQTVPLFIWWNGMLQCASRGMGHCNVHLVEWGVAMCIWWNRMLECASG